MTFSHDLYLARGHKEATKWCLDGRKQNNTCTAVPVRRETVLKFLWYEYTADASSILDTPSILGSIE